MHTYRETTELLGEGLERAIDNVVLCHNTQIYIKQQDKIAGEKKFIANVAVQVSAAPLVIQMGSWFFKKISTQYPFLKMYINNQSTELMPGRPGTANTAPATGLATSAVEDRAASAAKLRLLKRMGLKAAIVGKDVFSDAFVWATALIGELGSEELSDLETTRIPHLWGAGDLKDNPNWLYGMTKIDMRSYALGRQEAYAYGLVKVTTPYDGSREIAHLIHGEEARCLKLAGSKVNPFDPKYDHDSKKIAADIGAEKLTWSNPALIQDRNTTQRVLLHPEEIMNSEYMAYLGCNPELMAQTGCPQIQLNPFWQDLYSKHRMDNSSPP